MREAAQRVVFGGAGLLIATLIISVATLLLDLKEERDRTRGIRQIWLDRVTQNKRDIRELRDEMARRREVFLEHLVDHPKKEE